MNFCEWVNYQKENLWGSNKKGEEKGDEKEIACSFFESPKKKSRFTIRGLEFKGVDNQCVIEIVLGLFTNSLKIVDKLKGRQPTFSRISSYWKMYTSGNQKIPKAARFSAERLFFVPYSILEYLRITGARSSSVMTIE